MHSVKKYLLIPAIFLCGLAVGWGANYVYQAQAPKNTAKEIREIGDYRFINPLLDCDISAGLIDSRKENFTRELTTEVQQVAAKNNIVISVYYRDLNNGPTFGVKESEEFIPASLLKVPIMMAYFHEAQNNPAVLTESFTLDKRIQFSNGKQFIPPKNTLQIGQSYTVNELIEQSIIYSDNDAIALLIDHVSEADVRDLYQLLGVSQVPITFPDGRLTVREYASFFRILFNSSYLSRDYSEKALEILSRADFKDGLVAGVPPSVVVAHKFGEAGNEENHQIHDCGIVYAKNRPYLLCVMTRGGNINVLTSAIAEISRFVYAKIDSLNSKS